MNVAFSMSFALFLLSIVFFIFKGKSAILIQGYYFISKKSKRFI
ncbi:putative membrane protein [[Clostridium] sordellii ATCC 9714]|nr:putative membrane protein [[Clostridium] sordellii ATCC 9714] [Paeniclostridium sordellii ATCC 9714]